MNARDEARAAVLEAALAEHARDRRPLPGIDNPAVRSVFLRQLIDSLHRVRYPTLIVARPISERRTDPADAKYFDPVRAAAFHLQRGNIDEACWLVFLFVHFGRHARGGYRYARDVYGRLNQGPLWNWPSITGDLPGFLRWIETHHHTIRTQGGAGGFGSHRKYESLKPDHTGRAIQTYTAWVGPGRGHEALLQEALEMAGGDVGIAFNVLYESMNAVASFGRTARFDYLTMLGKLGVSPIAPASVHLAGATGPLAGARLLYGVGAEVTVATVESWLCELDVDIRVGPQALEDALCNWQKVPDTYRAFRG